MSRGVVSAPSALANSLYRLSSVRKKRKPAPGYKKVDDIKSYTQINHVPSLHATKPAGITALDLAQDGNTVVTGGADKAVQVFDFEASKVLGTLKGHTKAVTHVAFREHEGEPRLAISASADKTVRVWGEDDGKWGARATLSGHKGEINGLAVHPSGSYVAAGSADSTWSLYDLSTAKEVTKYTAIPGIDGSFAYTSFAVHPDGVLHGGGTKDAPFGSGMLVNPTLSPPHCLPTPRTFPPFHSLRTDTTSPPHPSLVPLPSRSLTFVNSIFSRPGRCQRRTRSVKSSLTRLRNSSAWWVPTRGCTPTRRGKSW